MEARLLGPLDVRVAGQTVELGPPKQRLVLAVLLVDAGRSVPVPTVVDRVWDEDPPAGARNALYGHIMRIRRALASAASVDGGRTRLDYRDGGYCLDVDPDLVDAHHFRQLVEQAQGCRDDERAALLRRALGLWRGVPLMGLSGEWVQRLQDRWGMQRVDATIAWARAELAIGSHEPVISLVPELIDEFPLVEPLTGVLMRALHVAGRPAEALDRYATIQRRIADELGVSPGPELQSLHQAVLRGDLGQRRELIRPTQRAARAGVPAQLPTDVPDFTGRAEELGRLDAVVASAGDSPTASVILAVSGLAGVGKTALAVHWAHRVSGRYPDGQLYANLRGFDPVERATSPSDVVRGFLEALGVTPQHIPTGLDAQAALYRSLLAGRRVLIVLDNARDSQQVRPLLPGAPGCVTVVTSRDRLTGVVAAEGAHPVLLDLFTAAEARQMLAGRLGMGRVAADIQAVDTVVVRCGRLPLALAVAAARAATQPELSIAVLAHQSRDAGHGLDAFASGDASTDVRAVFSWSYRKLTPEAARVFRLLGIHPGTGIGAAAAAALAGTTAGSVTVALTELTTAHLVAWNPTGTGVTASGRYSLHDLLRLYAAELADAVDSESEQRAALSRVFDYYLHTAHAAARVLSPHRHPITLSPLQPGVTPERFDDDRRALAWFTSEYHVILAAIERAGRMGCDTQAWQLAWTLETFVIRRGHWDVHLSIQHLALEAARRLDDLAAKAQIHRGLGRTYAMVGRDDDAHAHHAHALKLFTELGDVGGQAHVHLGVGEVCARQRRFQDALDQAQRSLELFRQAGQPGGQASALTNLGWIHTVLGHHRRALTSCGEALALFRQLGDRHGQAATLDSLGHAHHRLGDHHTSITCYQQAIDVYEDIGALYHYSDVCVHLGDTYRATGRLERARRMWHKALDILEGLGHPDADRVRTKLQSEGNLSRDGRPRVMLRRVAKWSTSDPRGAVMRKQGSPRGSDRCRCSSFAVASRLLV